MHKRIGRSGESDRSIRFNWLLYSFYIYTYSDSHSQAVLKLVKGLQNWRLYVSIIDFGEMLFSSEKISQASAYYRILREASRRHVSLIWKNVFVLWLGVGIFLLYPAYTYLRGAKPMVVPVLLIGVDSNTVYGYYINIGFQIVVSICTGMGIIAMDVFMIASISVFSISNDVVSYHCKEISQLKMKESDNRRLHEKLYFRNVMGQIQDIDE